MSNMSKIEFLLLAFVLLISNAKSKKNYTSEEKERAARTGTNNHALFLCLSLSTSTSSFPRHSSAAISLVVHQTILVGSVFWELVV